MQLDIFEIHQSLMVSFTHAPPIRKQLIVQRGTSNEANSLPLTDSTV
jgi:hypothetical protein